MARFVSRHARWLTITSGSLILAAGIAWAWTRWRGVSDLVERGSSAYLRRDYRQAAELARGRLKATPDDKEAVRLLARASARLGRDVPANALFARLGSEALRAEDLYLLGLGLSRAGQKESAVRIWERGLAIDPDHAEMLEQSMTLNLALSRLLEAAHLAERLARQPGWEFRGELALGDLRAEMSDPANAAAILARALERPEASRLEPGTANRYRDVLARSLLKIERPDDARAVLQKVLESQPDSAAYWLLSRVALQKGTIPDAIAAIKGAGTYRADHPLELEPSLYVGESRCASCHADKSRAFEASRHASTLVRGKDLLKLPYPDFPVADPDDAAVTHAFRRDGDRVRYQTRVKDKVLDAVINYAFGSPHHYVSFVGHDVRDQPYIFRLSHYQTDREAGWVRTTGHAAGAEAGHDFLGKPIEGVEGVFKCLFCHATDPRAVLDRSGPVASDRAIGCERCHGPGGNHLRAVEAKFPDLAIVNPAGASAEGRLRVCGQCHSNHQESPLPRTDPYWLRFQGTTIAWSRCYTESAGSFDCMTCHNPHHDDVRSPALHNARCLSCHSSRATGEVVADAGPSESHKNERVVRGSTCPVRSADGCVDCHMPSRKIQPLHATFTDHFIRVHRETKP